MIFCKAPKFTRNPVPAPEVEEESEKVGPAIPFLEEKANREDPERRLDLPADYFA